MNYLFSAKVSLQDAVTAKLRSINDHWKGMRSNVKMAAEDVEWFESSMKRIQVGKGLALAGAGLLTISALSVRAGMEINQLEGDLRSLGVTAADTAKISAFGIRIAADMGIAREAYLQGSYDIKSAISSLSSDTLPDYAETVARTATATKGEFSQMAQLFGMVHNQFRAQYADLSDKDMGKLIGTMISTAVQKYRTDGAKMEQAMVSLGSTAASLNISLSEQTAVLGTLQNTMNPGEAGTAYRAFLTKVGPGMTKLGLSAKDATGELKAMPVILNDIRAKFGETIDPATELPELVSAFGEEGAKTILNLLPHTEALKGDVAELNSLVANKDWSAMGEMSDARLNTLPAVLSRIREGWHGIFTEMGKMQGGPLTAILGGVATFVSWIARLVAERPGLAQIAGAIIGIGGALMLLVGGYMIATGALNAWRISNYYAAIAQGQSTAASTANLAVTIKQGVVKAAAAVKTWALVAANWAWSAAQWAVNAAMYANPIVWVIIGLVALAAGIYLVIKHWDWIKAKTLETWDKIKALWDKIPNWGKYLIAALFLIFMPFIALPVLIYANWDKLKGWFSDLWGSISDTASAWGNSVYNYFANWGNRIWQAFVSMGQSIKATTLETWQWFTNTAQKYVILALLAFAPIIGLPLLIATNWKLFKGVVMDLFAGNWSAALEKIKQIAKNSGLGFILAFIDGMKSGVTKLIGAGREVFGSLRKMMPFSDAKEGPLADITRSGRAFPATFGEGMRAGTPFLAQRADEMFAPISPDGIFSSAGRQPAQELSNALQKGSQGFQINVASLIGQLIMPDGGTTEGTASDLADVLARLIMQQLENYGGATP